MAQSQVNPPAEPVLVSDERMTVPPVVAGTGYALAFTSETPRANYVRGAFTVDDSFDDNVFSSAANPVSDVSHHFRPQLAFQQTRERTQWSLAYSPGFTIYQRTSARNQVDHNLNADVEYRLSPYASIRFEDSFARTSNLAGYFNETFTATGPAAGQLTSLSVIPPLADLLMNRASIDTTYQYGRNDMLGAKASMSRLDYMTRSQALGLYDSRSQAAEAFYAHRFAPGQYVGVSYRYQILTALPGALETQVGSTILFYSMALPGRFSWSLFAGPERSTTRTPGAMAHMNLTPAYGAELGFQGRRTSAGVKFATRIADGGGLPGAVRAMSIEGSLRRQISRSLVAQLLVANSRNTVLQSILGANRSGATLLTSASLSRQLSERVGLQFGYSHEQQRYNFIPATYGLAERNRIWVSLSYQMERPVGR